MGAYDFDGRTALFLAAVCGQTYLQFDNPDGMFVVPRNYELAAAFKATSFDNRVERFGFILESDDRIIVAFRGTVTISNWASDAIARQKKYPYARNAGWTHCGFTDIYRSARAKIISALNRLSARKPLYVAGHSLGGALATLCALDAASNSPFRAPRIYTYGSPRVGDLAFAKAFGDSIACSHRIHNVFDVVPQVPPILYKSPRTKTLYHYMHVKTGCPLRFRNGSVSANHIIESYYAELSKLEPKYAKELNKRNPGFCPSN